MLWESQIPDLKQVIGSTLINLMINFNGQLTDQSYQIENNRGFLYGDSRF